MSNKILVTYASRTGSTAEIAETIGRTLSEDGVQVDVMPMNAVKDLSMYPGGSGRQRHPRLEVAS